MNISFIGFGNMAKSIARGLLTNKTYKLSAAAPSLSIGINQQGIHTHHDNKAIIHNADVIILAVKPAQLNTVLQEIKSIIPAHCLLISVAAGIKLDWLANKLQTNIAIVRAMPNVAGAIGQSATPLIANTYVSTQQQQIAQQIFITIGQTTWIEDENDMNTFTALSGSGPAYVFLFMEGLIKAATELGLNEAIATSFTLQMVKGAVDLALSKNDNLGTIRNTVTSKGGTTAAAIQVLIEHDLEKLLYKAMQAASQRAQELSQLEE